MSHQMHATLTLVLGLAAGYFFVLWRWRCKTSRGWQEIAEARAIAMHRAERRIIDLECSEAAGRMNGEILIQERNKFQAIRQQIRRMKGRK